MGSFAYSAHIKHRDAQAVADAIERILADRGYETTNDEPTQDALRFTPDVRAVHVAELRNGWVGILDNDLTQIGDLVADLSEELETYGLVVCVNDSDSWQYDLFENGQLLDSFSSDPEFDDASAELGEIAEFLSQAPEGARQKLEEVMEKMRSTLTADMPAEIQRTREQLEAGQQPDPAALERYSEWAKTQTHSVLGELAGMLGIEVPTDQDNRTEDDGDEATELDDVEDEELSVDESSEFFDEDDEGFEDEEYAEEDLSPEEHAEVLRPLLSSGTNSQQLLQILEEEETFAEVSLARFLSALGIPAGYADLSYEYLAETNAEEMAADSIELVRHLKFRSTEAE